MMSHTLCHDCGVQLTDMSDRVRFRHVHHRDTVYVTCTGRMNAPCDHPSPLLPHDYGRACDACLCKAYRRDVEPGGFLPLTPLPSTGYLAFRRTYVRSRTIARLLGASHPGIEESRCIRVAATALAWCHVWGIDLQRQLERRARASFSSGRHCTEYPGLDAILDPMSTDGLVAALDFLEEGASA